MAAAWNVWTAPFFACFATKRVARQRCTRRCFVQGFFVDDEEDAPVATRRPKAHFAPFSARPCATNRTTSAPPNGPRVWPSEHAMK